jgi:hypothetical protein
MFRGKTAIGSPSKGYSETVTQFRETGNPKEDSYE